MDEFGEWTDEVAARVAASQRGEDDGEYGSVKLRQPIDMQTLCASKGQILELDQRELDPAELARAATQMAMDEVKENQQSYQDPYLTQEFNSNIPSKERFHQRLIDNTQDFDDQVKNVPRVTKTSSTFIIFSVAIWNTCLKPMVRTVFPSLNKRPKMHLVESGSKLFTRVWEKQHR